MNPCVRVLGLQLEWIYFKYYFLTMFESFGCMLNWWNDKKNMYKKKIIIVWKNQSLGISKKNRFCTISLDHINIQYNLFWKRTFSFLEPHKNSSSDWIFLFLDVPQESIVIPFLLSRKVHSELQAQYFIIIIIHFSFSYGNAMQSQVASDDEKNLFFMLCEIYENSKSYASLIRFPHVISMIPPSTM